MLRIQFYDVTPNDPRATHVFLRLSEKHQVVHETVTRQRPAVPVDVVNLREATCQKTLFAKLLRNLTHHVLDGFIKSHEEHAKVLLHTSVKISQVLLVIIDSNVVDLDQCPLMRREVACWLLCRRALPSPSSLHVRDGPAETYGRQTNRVCNVVLGL